MMGNNWTTKKFGECVEKILDHRGKTPKKLNMDWGNGDILALSANNVKDGYIDTELEANYASESLYEKWMTTGDLDKGDIVMTMEAPLGNVTQIPDNKRYLLSQRVAAFKPIAEIDKTYFRYYLLSNRFQSLLDRFSTGTTAKGISQKNLKPLEFSYPPLKEQQKIAAILSSVDEEIEKTEEIIEQTARVKKGLMQELLTKGIGHTKFKDSPVSKIPRAWTVIKLEDIFHTIDGDRGKNYPNEKDFMEEGHCIFLDTKNVTKNGFSFQSKKFISKEKDQSLRNGKLNRNDIVMTSRGTIGNIAFYDSDIPFEDVRINSAMLILRKKNDSVVHQFWLHLLRGKVINEYIRKFKVGSAQPHITKKSLNQLKIAIPQGLEEQENIASILTQIDDLI